MQSCKDGESIHLTELKSTSASEFSIESPKAIQQKANKTACGMIERVLTFDVGYVRAKVTSIHISWLQLNVRKQISVG